MNTTASSPNLVTGVVERATDGRMHLAIPGVDYLLQLETGESRAADVGSKITGVISAQARRIDAIRSGGRFVEPVEGPPRRVQGTVMSVDESEGAIVVNAGVPVSCKVGPLQSASQFEVGSMVTMGVAPGATFTSST